MEVDQDEIVEKKDKKTNTPLVPSMVFIPFGQEGQKIEHKVDCPFRSPSSPTPRVRICCRKVIYVILGVIYEQCGHLGRLKNESNIIERDQNRSKKDYRLVLNDLNIVK